MNINGRCCLDAADRFEYRLRYLILFFLGISILSEYWKYDINQNLYGIKSLKRPNCCQSVNSLDAVAVETVF